jgi:translation initiation factor 5A
MKEPIEVRELKVNRYIIIDDEPCKIVLINVSRPGKHGEAKVRIEAFGIFDNKRRSVVYPVRHKVQMPIVNKRQAQVIALMGEKVQLMDLQTYEIFELPIPGELKGKLQPGKEVFYLDTLDKRKITHS